LVDCSEKGRKRNAPTRLWLRLISVQALYRAVARAGSSIFGGEYAPPSARGNAKAKETLIKGALLHVVGKERMESVDEWIKKQDGPSLDREEAVRCLVDIGLRKGN
jgi:hypothetical protein